MGIDLRLQRIKFLLSFLFMLRYYICHQHLDLLCHILN